MKKTKEILKMIRCNIGALVGFECLYKILSLVIFSPLFLKIFDLTMKVTGYSYLTFENIFSFLLNPLTFFLLFILVMIMMLYSMFDITTIIVILDQSYQNRKIKVLEAILISLQKCKKVFRLKNLPLAFLVLFLIPFLNIGVASGFVSTIHIPEFIMDYIKNNQILILIFSVVVILLIALLLKWIYALHYYVLEDSNFKEARRKSKFLGSKKHLKDLISLILIQATTTIIYFIFVGLGILIIFGLNKLLKILIVNSIITTIIWIFIALSFLVYTALAVPISYAGISVLYYQHKKEKKEEINPVPLKENQKKSKNNKILKVVFSISIIIAILFGSIFTYGLYKGKYNLNIEFTRTVEVTAHRGASIKYPENTMSAFVGAKELGADWIELDVQQTSDGKIIVIHDTNLKRTTGLDKKTWEVDFEEISKLDAGSFFSEDFKGERIPLLEDVVDFAKKNNIKLNIELKPTGHEVDFEKSVIDIINAYDFKDDSVITSQVYEVLEKVKKQDVSQKTVYVMSLAYGNITSLKAADSFSIEETSITKSLVSRIHNEGKEIYAWTVNNEDNIQKMIDLKVDNIITDNIEVAKETAYKSKTSNVIKEYIKLIDKFF